MPYANGECMKRHLQEISQKVGQILDSRDLAASLAKKGLEQAQKFSWEKTIEETIKIYKKVIKNTPQKGKNDNRRRKIGET